MVNAQEASALLRRLKLKSQCCRFLVSKNIIGMPYGTTAGSIVGDALEDVNVGVDENVSTDALHAVAMASATEAVVKGLPDDIPGGHSGTRSPTLSSTSSVSSSSRLSNTPHIRLPDFPPPLPPIISPGMDRSLTSTTFSSDSTASSTSSLSSDDDDMDHIATPIGSSQTKPPTPLRREQLVNALEVFADFDARVNVWGHRFVESADAAKIVSVVVLPARDQAATLERMKQSGVNETLNVPVPVTSSLPIATVGGSPITQVHEPFVPTPAVLSVPGLVQHMTAKLPVRKCWWEVVDGYIDALGNFQTSTDRPSFTDDAPSPRLSPLRRRGSKSSVRSTSVDESGLRKRSTAGHSVGKRWRLSLGSFGRRSMSGQSGEAGRVEKRVEVRVWVRRVWLAEFVAV
ncbi:hypothetical protein BC829DRAFT_396120 [Chytridium lagenaria]|nr:hypothetical protein BC829DRAFT_396120 [Chytridium lagenaria]